MIAELQGWLDSTPAAVYLLVSSSDRAGEVGDEVIEECDDQDGIQAHITTDELIKYAETEHEAFNHVIREAKVGSRWGKDLLDYYRDFVDSMVNSVDDTVLEDELVAQFSKYDTDPYESAFIGEPLSLGLNLSTEISERVNTIESSNLTFNRTDLAAAVGYNADIRNIDGSSAGTILIEFSKPLSDVTKSQELSYLPRVIQELLLIGLSVVMVGPDTGTDEVELVEEFFRSVGRFDLHELRSNGITVSDETESWLGSWYEQLCYDVSSGQVTQDVARAATARSFDLKQLPPLEREYTTHFVNAIEHGLHNQYSEQKLNGAHKDQFDELWDKVVKPHPNYYQYQSQRNSFPRIRVARKDGEVREFILHHEGPLLDLHLNGVPVGSDNEPSKALVNTIETFLDAERLDEERWSTLIKFVEDRLSDLTEVSSQELVERVLFYQGIIPPADLSTAVSTSEQSVDDSSEGYDSEWYRNHWRTILSSHRVTSQAGLRLIKDKQELMEDLNGEDTSTMALYAKLERDIERAWEHYSSDLIEAIETGVTGDIVLEVSESRDDSSKTLNIQARNTRSGQEKAIKIEVYMPYRDVRVDGRQVSRPTISNSTDEVLVSLAGLSGSQVSKSVDVDDLLYDLITLYDETRANNNRSLVYFDKLVEFCLSIPSVPDLFRGQNKSAEEELRQALGSQELKQRLERAGSTYHRKGTDPYTGIKVGNDRYVAVELQVREL